MKRAGLSVLSPLPVPAAGQYFYTTSPIGSQNSATLGVGTLRLAGWYVPRTFRLSRLAAEVATVGEAGSKLRLGIYADSGGTTPGALVVDAGTINGDSATVQELTIDVTLAPGLYWTGAVVQVVTTTQPTVRIGTTYTYPVMYAVGASLPAAAGTTVGWQQTGVTGALPSTFAATGTTAGVPRIIAKAA